MIILSLSISGTYFSVSAIDKYKLLYFVKKKGSNQDQFLNLIIEEIKYITNSHFSDIKCVTVLFTRNTLTDTKIILSLLNTLKIFLNIDIIIFNYYDILSMFYNIYNIEKVSKLNIDSLFLSYILIRYYDFL